MVEITLLTQETNVWLEEKRHRTRRIEGGKVQEEGCYPEYVVVQKTRSHHLPPNMTSDPAKQRLDLVLGSGAKTIAILDLEETVFLS